LWNLTMIYLINRKFKRTAFILNIFPVTDVTIECTLAEKKKKVLISFETNSSALMSAADKWLSE